MKEQRPERFGNYDLIRPIDTGGMGEVYLAHQRSAFGRPVAIKIIRSDLVHDMTARARFLREAEVSAHLKHEHILPLFEFGEDQGRLFLVTPYIEGGTLARRLRSGSLSLLEVRQLFVPLVQAVAYIHRRGVIHRDLKPTNILLDEQDGQVYVRLIDFGIATMQGNEASPPLTTAGNEVGTIAYMAPERLNGIAAPSNDIFSLGVILHQMLTGNLPMGDQIDDMPDPLIHVVSRCIALRPEERFHSAEEVLKHFERAYQLIMSPTRPSSVLLSQQLDNSTISGAAAHARPAQDPSQLEMVSLEQAAQLSPIQPVQAVQPVLASSPSEPGAPFNAPVFGPGDYNAPTTSFNAAWRQPSPSPALNLSARLTPAPPVAPPIQAAHPRRQRGKRSLLPLLSALTVVVALAIAVLAYYGIQAVTTTAVTVNFSPKVLALSNTYTITAATSAQNVDVTNAIIPARGFMVNQTASKNGKATGQVNCVFGIFGCQTGVSQEDVDRLANQERTSLQARMTTTLQQEVAGAGGTAIATIKFSDVSITPDPAVGQQSTTVTVTLVEQGSIVYYVNADAQSVARQLLARHVQQLGGHYVLVKGTVLISSPVVKSIDAASGRVILSIAAGGDVIYQFPASQLRAIQNGLAGKTLGNAHTFLGGQPGIDQATISINFTRGSGTTLPGDIQQITIVPINASSYPPIHLGATASVPSPTPSVNEGTPAVSATPTSGADN
jgi:serine/threonine protein kinase